MTQNEKDLLVRAASAYVKNLEQYQGFLDKQVSDKAAAAADLAILRAKLTSAEPAVAALVAQREGIIAAATKEEDSIFPGEKVEILALTPTQALEVEGIDKKLNAVDNESRRVAQLEAQASQWVGFGTLALQTVPENEAREILNFMLTSRRAVLEQLKAAPTDD